MNIYKFDDTDFIAAESEKEAIDFYEDYILQINSVVELLDLNVIQLTEKQLENYIFYYDMYDNENIQKQTTFKKRLEELIEQKEEFPLFFASTEY